MADKNSRWASYYYSGQEQKRAKLIFKIFFWLVIFLITASIFYGSFFVYKIYSTEKKINHEPNRPATILKTAKSLIAPSAINLKGMERERINILLLGIAGKGKPGQNLTDTIMIASINPRTNQVALFSIPRDFFVNIPEIGLQGKINSIYQSGISSYKSNTEAADLVAQSIKDITALDMDYYIILNFDGFQKIIDSVGGINIMNERDIYDASYPGPNYSYEKFELSKGFHHLDGAAALKYVRERHNDPEGDFGRAKRQQQVMQATKNKIFSTGIMLNVVAINNLLDALGEAVETNINPDEFESFLELSKKLDTQNINNSVLDAWNKDSLLKVSHVQYGNIRAFALVPRVGNYSEIQELAQNIFDLNKIKRRREAIAEEGATIAIINQSGNLALTGKIKKLLGDNLGYKNIFMLNSPDSALENKAIVYDLTGGTKPFTLDELVGKLPASLASDVSSYVKNLASARKADMIIVLGKDLVDIYNVEEGTIDDLNKQNDVQESAEFSKN